MLSGMGEAVSTKPLTPKQQRFVAEYAIDLNATQAAIRAGYASANADVTGPRLLGNVGIAAAIAAASKKVEIRALVTREMVINGLLELAQAAEGVPAAVRRSAWRDLGEHLSMFKIVVDHQRVAELAESLGLDPSEVQAEAEAILKGAR